MVRTVSRLLAATLLLVPLLLATLAVAPAFAGGGCHGPDGTVHTEGEATVVRMDVCAFAPTAVHVPVGTEVRFVNTAPVEHLVVGEAQGWGTRAALAPGEAFSRRFDTRGVFPYSCPLHSGMVGAVVVGGGGAAGAVAPPPVAAEPAAPIEASAPAAATQSGLAPAAVALLVAVIVGVVAAGAMARRGRPNRPGTSPREA